MRNIVLVALLTLGAASISTLGGCTAAQKQEIAVLEADAVSVVRSAAIIALGGYSAVQANATNLEEALAFVDKLTSDPNVKKLDAEAQAIIADIQANRGNAGVVQADLQKLVGQTGATLAARRKKAAK